MIRIEPQFVDRLHALCRDDEAEGHGGTPLLLLQRRQMATHGGLDRNCGLTPV